MGRWQFEIVKTNWHVADVIDCRRPVLCLCWWVMMTELGLWIGFDVCMMRCRRSLYKRGGPPDITSRSLPTTDTHNGRPTRYQSSLTHWLTVLFISQYMTPTNSHTSPRRVRPGTCDPGPWWATHLLLLLVRVWVYTDVCTMSVYNVCTMNARTCLQTCLMLFTTVARRLLVSFHTWLLFSAADELRIMFNVYIIDIETTGVNPDDAPAPCGLRGCKNWPAPFPGRMSYKATKPGLALSIIS